MTIEDKLRVLEDCGLKLKDQFGVSDLIESWGQEALDTPGYNMALICLGMSQEEPPWTPYCDNIWFFDTECIEDHNDYVRIAKRLTEMTQGSLPLSDFEDYVDIEEGKAWLRFKCQGQLVHFDFNVEDDWVDMDIFSHFANLLAKCEPNKLFFIHVLEGQSVILGCTTYTQFEKIQNVIPEIEEMP